MTDEELKQFKILLNNMSMSAEAAMTKKICSLGGKKGYYTPQYSNDHRELANIVDLTRGAQKLLEAYTCSK